MPASRPKLLWAGLALLLVGQAVLYGWLLGQREHQYQIALAVAATLLWVGALALLARVPSSGRAATVLVLGVAAVLDVIAMTHRPATSSDDFRYLWDAKVQLAGVDPYRYAPSSPHLAGLRDRFPFHDSCTYSFPGGCTAINRPTVHTVYPPVAQLAFDAVRIASFGGRGGHLPLQLAAALGCLAVGWLLLRRGRPPWLAALWAWCPVTVVEYANNAHVDWLAVLLTVLAFVVVFRPALVGMLAGAAIAVKLYPALAVPALMRRDWRVAPYAIGLVAVSYVPHVVAVGTKVIGYLPGYLHDEQYGSGGRLLLLGAVLPNPADTVIGAAVVAVVALWAWRRGSPEAPERSAVVVVGVAFLVFTPHYSWYAGVLLALVALTGAIEWVPIVLAPSYVYLIPPGHAKLIYLVAVLAMLMLVALRQACPSVWPCTQSISNETDRSPSSPSTRRR